LESKKVTNSQDFGSRLPRGKCCLKRRALPCAFCSDLWRATWAIVPVLWYSASRTRYEYAHQQAKFRCTAFDGPFFGDRVQRTASKPGSGRGINAKRRRLRFQEFPLQIGRNPARVAHALHDLRPPAA